MEYIRIFVYVCTCVCLTYGQTVNTSANCVGIQCSPPDCFDSFIPLGGCCPVCPGPGRPCSYRGKNYQDGQNFQEECNTCECTDGSVSCTQMFCPDEKSGSCPVPTGPGICVESCSRDNDCPRRQKCCSNGCGHTCMRPEKGKACVYKGVKYRNGASFMDDCNTCTCSNGMTSCTEMACPGKPGSCPIPVGNSICVETCTNDDSCPAEQKCCNNGCGQTCMTPINDRGSCVYKGVVYRDGENFMDDCNTCRCRNGTAGCTRMACPKRHCFHNGISYNEGETFKDGCNVCVCKDGIAECTLIACPEVKPGTCPSPLGIGICVDRCTTDLSCPGREKCCSNGCGTDCKPPENGGKPCFHKGVRYNDGDTFKDACNTCICNDGQGACTMMACPDVKPGECPAPVGIGSCVESCTTDSGCPGSEKCCSNGCGTVCLPPKSGGQSCLHKGISYNDGETFKDDCNTCRCRNGRAGCTRMACPDAKPGTCPPPLGGGICIDSCSTDNACPGREKCCNNGCGTQCMAPIDGGRPCVHNGVSYKDGESFKDDCNTCTCSNGNAACTLMACPGAPCLHKGIRYSHGETFKDDCNTCTCNDGRAGCTRMACPEGKPGTCPPSVGIGICVNRCTTDASCPGREKCCSNGCGTVCMLPETGGRPCVHKGVTYKDGERFKDDCNTCTCSNGNAACTLMACPHSPCVYKGISYNHGQTFKDECNTCTCNDGRAACTLMACPDEKPGKCPPPVGFGICVDRCTTDLSCPGREKCCSNGCGTDCILPVKGRSCYHKGIEYADGESFKDSCNTCKCSDGKAACTKMACGGGCLYRGRNYNEGDSFKDDCNTCNCNGGKVVCTLMACPESKPGTCPIPTGGGICIEDCTADVSCPGSQKCCSNGCGSVCMKPDFGGSSCFHKGSNYTDGESFKDDCNTCTCTNGNVACTLMACPPRNPCYYNGNTWKDGETFMNDCNTCICTDGRILCTSKACGKSCDYKGKTYKDGDSFKDDCNTCTCSDGKVGCTLLECSGEKPGRCPRPTLFSLCLNRCNGDQTCPGQKKCCPSWCGNSCSDPVGDSCAGVVCPAIECQTGSTPYKPPGSCCEICRPPAGEKPGICPRRPRRGPCVDMCNSDYSCPGQQKCCENRCGRSCMRPDRGRCDGVSCPPLRCSVQFRPPGQCCPRCRGGRE